LSKAKLDKGMAALLLLMLLSTATAQEPRIATPISTSPAVFIETLQEALRQMAQRQRALEHNIYWALWL
jgi:hypothetical protein